MPRKFHKLTPEQRLIMLKAGFLPREIKEFDENLTTNFDYEYFKRMLRSRAKWIEAMRLNNWTDKEIARRIAHYLSKKKDRSPWDFFRLEYISALQKPTLTRSKFAHFLKLRHEISANFGRAYGRIQSVKRLHMRGLAGVPRKKRREL